MSENNATMSAEMPASAPAFGSDVKRLPLKDLLKRIGPGLIATGIVIGPGAVTTASMIGANYGYDLMWLFFPIIFMGITRATTFDCKDHLRAAKLGYRPYGLGLTHSFML